MRISGQFKGGLTHSTDYFIELLILSINTLTQRIVKDDINMRDQKALLLDSLTNDFADFMNSVQDIYFNNKP